MAIKGLDQAIDNLSRVRKNAIPAASAMTINRVAITAINQSSSQVARETRVRRKLVKERSRLKRATVRNPNARIIVNRGDLPVIKLGIRMLVWGSDQFWAEFVQPGRTCKPCVARGMVI